MANNLPPELVDQILEHTRPDAHQSLDDVPPDCANMARYTLVCRNWSGSAQRALFRLVAPERSDGAQALVRALQLRPDLARSVEKLKLQLEGSWDVFATATALALCPNLRHFSFLVRYWQDPVVRFTSTQMDEIALGAPDVERLTALVFSTGSEECWIVPQLITIWPRLSYLDLRGRGRAPERVPQALRELRLMSSYILPVGIAPPPRLGTLYVNTSGVSLYDVIVPTLRKLCIILSESVEPPRLDPAALPALRELVLVTNRWLPDDLGDPHKLVTLGVVMRLVRLRPDALARWVRGASDTLRVVTVYVHGPADAFENKCMSIVRPACEARRVELQLRPIAYLWEVPLQYGD